jgi:hypothetical protein
MKMRMWPWWNDTDREMLTTNLTWTDLGSNMGHRGQRPRELCVENIPESSAISEIENVRQKSFFLWSLNCVIAGSQKT